MLKVNHFLLYMYQPKIDHETVKSSVIGQQYKK